tara:strand:- start:16 stop:117 length:102 start_codon:yes stop_codon:yes gene_type:complete
MGLVVARVVDVLQVISVAVPLVVGETVSAFQKN